MSKQPKHSRGLACAIVALLAVLSSAPAFGGTTTYHYDALGRVVLDTADNFSVDGYSYDAAGNRVTTVRNAVPPPTNAGQLVPVQGLVENTSIQSPNGQYTLVLQTDGNLVVYGPSGATWSDDTYGLPSAQALMQSDGNFVVYGPSNQVYWQSQTGGHPGASIFMQNDGNLVIYDTNGTPLWALSWQ